jgi:hypothetical protein
MLCFLVPKLYLGMHRVSAKLYFAHSARARDSIEAKYYFARQGHSQV